MEVSDIKSKVAAKVAKGKAKIAAKLKAVAVLAALAVAIGCASSEPASRVTRGEYGDIRITFENACSNSVSVTLGDAAYASADSEGSTETMTANPTLDIKTDITAKYNDAIKSATEASRSVLGKLGDGLGSVLDAMIARKTATVPVTLKDGTAATVRCENGQCSLCEDGECAPCAEREKR